MNRIVRTACICVTVLCLAVTLFAADKSDKKISVKFTADELAFSISALNSVDLTGEEVTPFIDIRNLLIAEYKEMTAGKKQGADINFTMATAKNFVFFLQRVKLKGAEANLFNDIISKMVETIKKESK
jgi:hypothetical protein